MSSAADRFKLAQKEAAEAHQRFLAAKAELEQAAASVPEQAPAVAATAVPRTSCECSWKCIVITASVLFVVYYVVGGLLSVRMCIETRIGEFNQAITRAPRAGINPVPMGCTAANDACYRPECSANWHGEFFDLIVWPTAQWFGQRSGDPESSIGDALCAAVIAVTTCVTAIIAAYLPEKGASCLYWAVNWVARRHIGRRTLQRDAQNKRADHMHKEQYDYQLEERKMNRAFSDELYNQWTPAVLSTEFAVMKPASSEKPTSSPIPVSAPTSTLAATAAATQAASAPPTELIQAPGGVQIQQQQLPTLDEMLESSRAAERSRLAWSVRARPV